MKCIPVIRAAFCGVMLLCLAASARAEGLKVAVIDMTGLMRGYDKSKVAEDELQQKADALEAEQSRLREQLNELNRQYKDALDDSKESALSDAARDKKKELAIEKLTELKKFELDARQKLSEAEKTLKTQGRRMQDEIIKELREKVQEYARNNGYDMVIDTITVIYTNDKVVDITENVAALLEVKK